VCASFEDHGNRGSDWKAIVRVPNGWKFSELPIVVDLGNEIQALRNLTDSEVIFVTVPEATATCGLGEHPKT
jgi:hypothetical protein